MIWIYSIRLSLYRIRECRIDITNPMRDRVFEVASIMNLILPSNMQLPVKNDFTAQYLVKETENLYNIKPDKIDELKSAFTGRVSVLTSMESDVEKHYVGSTEGALRHFHVDTDEMGAEQSAVYQESYSQDTRRGEKVSGFYDKSRQTSLFAMVEDDETLFGPELYSKYLKTAKGVAKLKTMLKGRTREETIENIGQFSSKYAKIIRQILSAKREGKCVYMYSEFVKGSGLILLSKLLEMVGYSKATGSESTKESRYALITGETTTTKDFQILKERFNQSDNVWGDYIHVILGSEMTTEGVTFNHIQEEHIITPDWNFTVPSQAIARGVRVGSHEILREVMREAGREASIRVEIHLHASIPEGGNSIDLEMYQISEDKDVSIKRMMRIMKESAFDCPLVYERNLMTDGVDGSRECDYQDCLYQCDGISRRMIEKGLTEDQLDLSTYEIYYSVGVWLEVMEGVKEIFKTEFSMNLEDILEQFPEYSDYEVVTALNKIISESHEIMNKYHIPCYLKEENNIYFLVSSLADSSQYFSSYYAKNPAVGSGNTFDDLLKDQYWKSLSSIAPILCGADYDRFSDLIKTLPPEAQEIIVEAAILSVERGGTKNTSLRDNILKYFDSYIHRVGSVWVSKLLAGGPLRCFSDGEWRDCPENILETVEKTKEKEMDVLLKNPYGYFATYKPDDPKYLGVVDLRKMKKGEQDKRKISRGMNCTSWKKNDLVDLLTTLQLDYPKTGGEPSNPFRMISGNDVFKSKVSAEKMEEIKGMSHDDQLRLLYWIPKSTKDEICHALRKWFDRQGLLTEFAEKKK